MGDPMSDVAPASRAEGLTHPIEVPPGEGQATEVAPGVLWMRLPVPGPLGHVNVYAIEGRGDWTLVDTGLDTPDTRAAWGLLLAGPLEGRPVGRVIVTHHHPDHVGLAGWFQAEHGAVLMMTRVAWLTARMLTLDVQERPTAEMLAFWRGAGMEAGELASRSTSRPFNFSDVVAPMPLGHARLSGGDVLRLGARDWTVRLGGGHAPDQATLWSGEDALVLGADQLLPTISPNIGVYATEPDADPLADWLSSCEDLMVHATPEQLVLPGHGKPFRGLPGRLQSLIDNHHTALSRLRAWLAEAPRTAAECFHPLFRREIGSGEYGLALVEAVAHLNHLREQGEVGRTRDEASGAWLWRPEPDAFPGAPREDGPEEGR